MLPKINNIILNKEIKKSGSLIPSMNFVKLNSECSISHAKFSDASFYNFFITGSKLDSYSKLKHKKSQSRNKQLITKKSFLDDTISSNISPSGINHIDDTDFNAINKDKSLNINGDDKQYINMNSVKQNKIFKNPQFHDPYQINIQNTNDLINSTVKILENLSHDLDKVISANEINNDDDISTTVSISRPTSKANFEDDCTFLNLNFIPSHFSFVPSTINFILPGQQVCDLNKDLKKLLIWKNSTHMPNVVKNVIEATGFRILTKNNKWIGYWGKHLKSDLFKHVYEYQKINHFPGSFQIGRKDNLWRNISDLRMKHGSAAFSFVPETYCLPSDLSLMKSKWYENGRKRWIVKPPASARGIGIKIISKWNDIPLHRAVIVQRYISNPFLINGNKFDLRIYVYVTSFDPLIIYIYKDGLARFASAKYSNSRMNIKNHYIHLTNYSINKNNENYFIGSESNNNAENGEDNKGYKWSLGYLWKELEKLKIDKAIIWRKIEDLVIKTIISCEAYVNPLISTYVKSRYCVHELYGFDILLDDNFKPWLLEVNISPSLNSNSQIDIDVKSAMIRDLLNLARFVLPEKNQLSDANVSQNRIFGTNAAYSTLNSKLFTKCLTNNEKEKHDYYKKSLNTSSILDILTPDDVRIIIQLIDEDARRGNFERIYPTEKSTVYNAYFKYPRYYNILLTEWLKRYSVSDLKGISIIAEICDEQIHLIQKDTPLKYVWKQPNKLKNKN